MTSCTRKNFGWKYSEHSEWAMCEDDSIPRDETWSLIEGWNTSIPPHSMLRKAVATFPAFNLFVDHCLFAINMGSATHFCTLWGNTVLAVVKNDPEALLYHIYSTWALRGCLVKSPPLVITLTTLPLELFQIRFACLRPCLVAVIPL
jgi:hypothetical protein